MTAPEAARKYAMTKIAAGDWLLPGNDGRTIFRLRSYVDGPSMGLDLPRDRTFWGVWRWTGGNTIDPDDADRWKQIDDLIDSRAEAIRCALRSLVES